MIIEFAVTNFRSIKERQVLSMLPSDRVKREVRRNATFHIPNYNDLHLLTTAGIFGRNSAGKSNLVKAFRAFEWLVLQSHKFTRGDVLHANESFLFDIQTHKSPTLFELDFLANDGRRYLYIVEFSQTEILTEELHYYIISPTSKTTKRKLYVRRQNQSISFGEDFKGLKKIRVLENVLFLSKSINETDTFLTPVFDFFKTGIQISDFSEGYMALQTRSLFSLRNDSDNTDIKILNKALQDIDTGILFLTSEKSDKLPANFLIGNDDEKELSDEQRRKQEDFLDILKTEIKAVHRLFEGRKEIDTLGVPLEEESEGTKKFIALYAAIMQFLRKGSLFVVDEFDKSLHPLLTQTLISLIANPNINLKGTQFIFTSHNALLMDSLDDDQINQVQKDFTGATEVYTVSDIRGLRGEVAKSKRYLRGDFEGIPTINNLSIQRNLEAHYGIN